MKKKTKISFMVGSFMAGSFQQTRWLVNNRTMSVPSGQAPDVQHRGRLARAQRDPHVETLKGQLAAAEARTDQEAAKAEKVIAELSALAERLAAIAEERARPWWRLVG
jgi:hypothetical protein